MPPPQPAPHYALKLHRAGEKPQWRTRLELHEALALAVDSMAAEERAPSPRYMTATIYRDAMVVAISRYFPAGMRVKHNDRNPPEDE